MRLCSLGIQSTISCFLPDGAFLSVQPLRHQLWFVEEMDLVSCHHMEAGGVKHGILNVEGPQSFLYVVELCSLFLHFCGEVRE